MKTSTEYRLKRGAVAAIVVLVIIIAALSYSVGGIVGSQTTTVALTTTTHLEVTTITASTVSSFTVESYIVQTSTEFVTITQLGPDQIIITGGVSMKTPGTVPQVVLFASASENSTYRAQVVEGRYTVQLPNHANYNIFIEYGTAVADVGAGKCLAGALGAWFQDNPPAMDWTC